MNILVLTAMDSEYAHFVSMLNGNEIKDKNIILSKCGIGKVNAAAETFGLIQKNNPDLVISSGVAGGSLLLIPVACSSFGISSDISMQVVGVGFIIGVLQDSCETALNSSSDVLFTATAEFSKRRAEGNLKPENLIPRAEE